MAERWVVQFCHCHYGPFLDVARQYAALFAGGPYKVLTVYLTGKPSDKARLESASDEVVFLDYASRQVRGLKLDAIRALRGLIADRDVALVIAHRFKPIYIACLATKLPVIGVHHAFGGYLRAPRRWFVGAFRRRLTLLGVSDAVRDDIRRCLPGWPEDKIQTLHNRIDVAAVRATLVTREEARATLDLPAEAKVIANVGRLHPDKDQATLLRGFAQARTQLPPGTLLAIAGSGPLEAELKALASALGIADGVRFLGQVPDVRRYFRAFDLFVLSSDHEPFGMVLLEAMAADVPIFATDCGGAPEVVADPAHLFALGNSDELATRLVAFFADAGATDSAARADNEAANIAVHCRLEQCFSDTAARRRFFSLPAVAAVLPSA